MKREEFLGCPVDSLTTTEALSEIDKYIARRTPHRITPINASKLCQVDSNRRLAEIIRKSDMVIPEYAVVWGANRLKIKLAEHIGGIMLMRKILEYAPPRGYSVYFLGAQPGVVNEMVSRIRNSYPGLKIAGFHHGYFSIDDELTVIDDIKVSKPDVLLVAMGTPKQEAWIDDHIGELGVPVIMGVGGSFDVFAGLKRETPPYLRCGFEWLYRLAQEPTRLWKRYMTTNSKFLWKIAKAWLGLIHNNGNGRKSK